MSNLIENTKQRIHICEQVAELGLTRGTRQRALEQLDRLRLTLQILEKGEDDETA